MDAYLDEKMITTEAHDDKLARAIAESLHLLTIHYPKESEAMPLAKQIVKKVRASGWGPTKACQSDFRSDFP